MDVKVYAYNLAISKFEKEVEKLDKQIDKLSTEMATMLDGNTSMKQRANKRARHSTLCESAERFRGYIEELKKLKEDDE